MGARERYAEDGISAEARFIGRAIEIAKRAVYQCLFGRRHTEQVRGYLLADVGDSSAYALTAVAARVAVAQLDRLVPPGAGAGRNDSPAASTALAVYLDFHGRIAAAVENLAGQDARDCFSGCHGRPHCLLG